MNQADSIVIIGGGPVGAVLALSLQQKSVPFTLLEARAKGASHSDTRALALSHGSRLILEKLNIWSAIEAQATAIKTIHISQRGGFGRTKLQAAEHQLPALGYVLPYGALTKALDAQLDLNHVLYDAVATEVRYESSESEVFFKQADSEICISSPLTVIADGGRSLDNLPNIERETKDYGHDALVSKVKTELPHANIAYERFTPTGPMALLPNGEHDFSLVWTGEKAKIDALMALSDADFLNALHAAFGDRVGRFLSIQKRNRFPLKLSTLKASVTAHLAIIGNAAQTMHPVAGQGFNVGLRDAEALAKLLIHAPKTQWGSKSMLQEYQKLRARDAGGSLKFTDSLLEIFSNDFIGVSGARGFGLGALSLLRPAREFLVGKMSYGK
ncbi:MAG: 2-octaprenyl-6-methoxyphenyl hydroxylase [Methylotenera sp.]|nr:MAG: 2-octaprenyl-6-methoxyphenyl hydroxylase [Methylotenera sp.]